MCDSCVKFSTDSVKSHKLARMAAIRGARLLDRKIPDWRKRIDIDRLNMRYTDTCIIGQLFGINSGNRGYDNFTNTLSDLLGLQLPESHITQDRKSTRLNSSH